MNTIEWKDDPSPLGMFAEGESAFFGHWKMRVDRMKSLERLDRVLKTMRGGMTKKEIELLDSGFAKSDEVARLYRRDRGRDTHPFFWKIEYVGDGSPTPFTHMGGQARTKEEAKALADRAIGGAMTAMANLRICSESW